MTDNVKTLRIHNFKNIETADIAANGNSIVLKGENGSGKSAHIEALGFALKGVPSKLVKSVIRDGQKSTFVFLDTGNLLITREQEVGKPTKLIVKDPEGVEYKSPQKMLNELFSVVTFDPGAFMMLKDADQLKTLKTLIDADGKITGVEEKLERELDLRKAAKKEHDRVKQVTDEMESDKSFEGKDLKDHNQLMGKYEAAKEQEDEHRSLVSQISNLKSIVEKLKVELQTAESDLEGRIKERNEFPEIPDAALLKTELESVEVHNEGVRKYQAKDKALGEVVNAGFKVDGLEESVKELREKIKEMITNSDMPVEGMTFGEDKLLLNGRDLKSCSTGEQIIASLKISMALNKGLKTIMIKDGSLLDEANRKLVLDFAKERGFQVIMEVVDEGKSVTVEIIEAA